VLDAHQDRERREIMMKRATVFLLAASALCLIAGRAQNVTESKKKALAQQARVVSQALGEAGFSTVVEEK
jgi:hypothetical protein